MTNPAADYAYQHLNKEMAPTSGASLHNKTLKRPHDNLGQGAEQIDLIEELLEFFEGKSGNSERNYNPVSGGPESLRAAMAAWTERMFGVEGNADNVSVAQQQGRGFFNDFVNVIATQYRGEKWNKEFVADPKHRAPAVLMPRNGWSLAHKIYKDAGFEIIEFDIENDDIAASLDKAIQDNKEDHIIAAVYFNFPHNATGLHLSDEQGRKSRQVVDKHNLSGDSTHKTALHLDVPYFSACPKDESNDAYLETGLRHIIDDNITDPGDVITPTAIIFSGSKAFRTAEKGFTWERTTPDLTPKLRAHHNMVGNGVRYDPVFFENLERGFHPDNDHLWQEQLDLDRIKFTDNYANLKQVHGDAVLKGGANLVALMKLTDVFGRAVECHDGVTRYIPELGDTPKSQKAARQAYLSYVANGTPEHEGIVLVDGDVDKDNNPLVRVALAKPQEDFQKANARYGEINEYIVTKGRLVSAEDAMTIELA